MSDLSWSNEKGGSKDNDENKLRKEQRNASIPGYSRDEETIGDILRQIKKVNKKKGR